MVIAPEKKLYTPADLLEMGEEGERYELLDGELIEVPVATLSDDIAEDLRSHMRGFVRANPIGHVLPGGTTLQIFAPGRLPRCDGGFIARGKLLNERLPEGHLQVVPDLVIESVSPTDKSLAVRRKVREYLAAGIRVVWVLYPDTLDAEAWRMDGTMTRIPPEGSLDGEDVIPGFRCALASVMPSPIVSGQPQG